MSGYQSVFCRVEVKFMLTAAQYRALIPVLKQYMVPDDFFKSTISNLYYDTPDFRLIRTSLAKPRYKEKLRLRCYNVPAEESQSFVEIKKKVDGVVYKRRACHTGGRWITSIWQRAPGGRICCSRASGCWRSRFQTPCRFVLPTRSRSSVFSRPAFPNMAPPIRPGCGST